MSERRSDVGMNVGLGFCDARKPLMSLMVFGRYGGGGGIRTHGTVARTTVFETAPIDHSGTPPQAVGVM